MLTVTAKRSPLLLVPTQCSLIDDAELSSSMTFASKKEIGIVLSTYDVTRHQGMTMAMDIWMFRTGQHLDERNQGASYTTAPHFTSPHLTSHLTSKWYRPNRNDTYWPTRIHGDSFQLCPTTKAPNLTKPLEKLRATLKTLVHDNGSTCSQWRRDEPDRVSLRRR